jgi:hypothetical protein
MKIDSLFYYVSAKVRHHLIYNQIRLDLLTYLIGLYLIGLDDYVIIRNPIR